MSHCGLKYCAVKTDLVKQFQAVFIDYLTVEVCMELPKFKLAVIQVKPLPVAEREPGTQQAGAHTAGGTVPADTSVLVKDAGHKDLAYVLHTSGTTGPPKTVRVPHKCILPNILHLRSLFQMSADDVVFLASPLTFDPSVVDIFLALSSGARLLIVPFVIKKMPSRLAQLLFKDHQITVLQATPSLLVRFGHRVLKQHVLSPSSSVRVLALGGEACPSPALLSSWRHEDNKTCIYNIYGITEVSCWACCYKIPEILPQSSDTMVSSVPLGTPLMDTVVEVRDELGRVIEEGEGQVFIGGRDRVCLLDDEDTVIPGTMRASGDWVIVKDRQLYYQGRRDRMIKRNGKRVNLDSLQQDTLGLPGDATIDEQSHFLFSGGDSLKALRLCEDILATIGASSPQLLEVILDGTFSDVLRQVTLTTSLETSSSSPSEAMKRHADPPSLVQPKRERKSPETLGLDKRGVTVVRRAGEVIEMNPRRRDSRKNQQDAKLGGQGSSRDVDPALGLSWTSDTGRCVDASPVVLVRDTADQSSVVAEATVFIGSHSHRVQALDLVTGSLLWERVLGGRIEASAAVSHCGSLVVVGCYDSCIYFLCAESGATRWVFETGDAVKSCPAVDPLTGLVMVGSHDGHVYALDPQARGCVWRRHCGGGAVFSSPHLDVSHRQLYVASLGGHLLCLNPDSGDVLWSYSREHPFFSSPNCFNSHVVIGSVDGNICCLSDTGKLLWQFLTEGPVFSSPCFVPEQQRLLCGSHDGRLYCLNCADGSSAWTFQTTGKVYSSPCVFDGSCVGRRGTLVGLASTDGTVWILDALNGQMLASHHVPGELFSSPVVWEKSLVIGCRNDYVYCLNLTIKKDT
ncbi:beta-alanine-activating enzyme [Xenentodon cancila]